MNSGCFGSPQNSNCLKDGFYLFNFRLLTSPCHILLTAPSVEHYDIKTDELLLKHQYPHQGPNITASVKISLVREALKPSVLQNGAWVNVVGYVQNENLHTKAPHGHVTVKVQAIMLWDTVALNVAEYEKAVQARKDAGTTC